jgi:DNA helicase HerA-like ATPase
MGQRISTGAEGITSMDVAPLLIARPDPVRGGEDALLLPAMANRHGLIAGATGTGKSVSLQQIAEKCSRSGIPILLADIKGDLSGLAAAGQVRPIFTQRRQQLGLPEPVPAGSPVEFWDVLGEQGHPLRATVSELGPLLLARLLGLKDTQVGC